MDTMTEMHDNSNIRSALVSAFSSQDSSILMNVFLDDNYLNCHTELRWFVDEIERATHCLLNIAPNDVGYHAKYAQAHDAVVRGITQKLSSRTLGFDINHIIALSGEMQEKAETKDFFLVILPYEDCSSIQDDMLLIFSAADQKTFRSHMIHAIRKQLNLAKDGGLAVCKNVRTGEFHTVGVLRRDAAEKYPRFYFSKRLKWEFYFPKEESVCEECTHSSEPDCKYTKHYVPCRLCRVRYDQGSLMMPITNITLELSAMIYQYLERKHVLNPSVITKNIMKVIEATDTCDHGAVLIFSNSDSIRREAERLASKHRGLLLPSPQNLLLDRNTGSETINRMAAIDGAILVDYDGLCYSYGTILDGKAVVDGSVDRGARYNSTNAYVKSQRSNCFLNWYRLIAKKHGLSFIGVTKSEDGMLNVFFCE